MTGGSDLVVTVLVGDKWGRVSTGLTPSVQTNELGKALALARLPADVIAAFPSPLDLQYRWASLLIPAIQKDPDLILARAKELRSSLENLVLPRF